MCRRFFKVSRHQRTMAAGVTAPAGSLIAGTALLVRLSNNVVDLGSALSKQLSSIGVPPRRDRSPASPATAASKSGNQETAGAAVGFSRADRQEASPHGGTSSQVRTRKPIVSRRGSAAVQPRYQAEVIPVQVGVGVVQFLFVSSRRTRDLMTPAHPMAGPCQGRIGPASSAILGRRGVTKDHPIGGKQWSECRRVGDLLTAWQSRFRGSSGRGPRLSRQSPSSSRFGADAAMGSAAGGAI
jgi:hypothetical protein